VFFNHLGNVSFSFRMFLLPVTEKVKGRSGYLFLSKVALLFQNERLTSSALSLGKFWMSSSKCMLKEGKILNFKYL